MSTRSRAFFKRVLIVGGVALAPMLMAVGAAAYLLYPTLRNPPVADYPPPASRAEANLQDLDFLGRNYPELNRSFTQATRAAFLAELAELSAKAGTLDAAGLEMGIAHAVALSDEGHARVRGVAYGRSLNALPIRLGWFAEGLFVIMADPEHTSLLGARIIEVAGLPIATLAEHLDSYVGGSAQLKRELLPYFLISPAALSAAGLVPAADTLELTMEVPGGNVVTQRVAATDSPAHGPLPEGAIWRTRFNNHWPARDLSPVTFPGDARPWTHLLPPTNELPLYLRNPDRFYWDDSSMPGMTYVQINAVRDAADGISLGAYLADILAQVRAAKPRTIVIDLRMNAGGNLERMVDFTRDLPQALAPGAHIYVLGGGNTFSAAISSAARLKYYGADRTTVVGLPFGDRGQFWAEGRQLTLPNSGLEVQYTTSWHDWENGCSLAQIGTCYLFNYLWIVPAGSLAPNVVIEQTIADYLAGRDTLMDWVIADAAGPPNS